MESLKIKLQSLAFFGIAFERILNVIIIFALTKQFFSCFHLHVIVILLFGVKHSNRSRLLNIHQTLHPEANREWRESKKRLLSSPVILLQMKYTIQIKKQTSYTQLMKQGETIEKEINTTVSRKRKIILWLQAKTFVLQTNALKCKVTTIRLRRRFYFRFTTL